MTDIHMCHAEAVAAALGVTVAVLVAIGAGIGFLVHRRNKRAKNMQDGGNSDAQVHTPPVFTTLKVETKTLGSNT